MTHEEPLAPIPMPPMPTRRRLNTKVTRHASVAPYIKPEIKGEHEEDTPSRVQRGRSPARTQEDNNQL